MTRSTLLPGRTTEHETASGLQVDPREVAHLLDRAAVLKATSEFIAKERDKLYNKYPEGGSSAGFEQFALKDTLLLKRQIEDIAEKRDYIEFLVGLRRAAWKTPLPREFLFEDSDVYDVFKNMLFPVDLLDQIENITGVPAAYKNNNEIKTALKVICAIALCIETDTKIDSSQRKEISKIGKLAIKLESEINNLSPASRLVLKAALRRTPTTYGIMSRELAHAAAQLGAEICNAKLDGHRPRDTFKHKGLTFLIRGLYQYIVFKAAGKLTISQDVCTGALGGSLPAVLKILRPYLPNVVPRLEDLSCSTLRRLVKPARAFKKP